MATETGTETDESDARIVIVEDERIVAVDIKSRLERFGYTVPAIYASGEAALENVETDSPDLVLLDIRLQGALDGVQTAEQLHQQYGLPFILLTAYSDEQTLERAKITQPFAYIIKPFDERELRTSIVIALYRHQMERALSERQELLDTTLKSIADGVVVTDMNDRIEFMNPVAEALSDCRNEDVHGKPFPQVFVLESGEPDDWPKSYDEYACMLRKSDGSTHAVERLQTPLLNSLGNEVGSVYIIRDISDRVKAERTLQDRDRQLQQAQKMEAVGRLSGGVAHDFNNLLTVILGHSKLLVEMLDDDTALSREQVKSDVLGIQKAAFRSVSLTRQLLAFSRHQVLNPRTIRVNTIVSEVEKMLRRLVSEGIVLHLALEAEEGTVFVDQGQMEQVIMNLVANARDSIEETGGTVLVRTEEITFESTHTVHTGELESGDWVLLHVQDNGSGIAAENLPYLFEPFFTTKAQTQGTGLGLSTVYGIIRQLGGHIDVHSTQGNGTRFTVYLPRATAQSNPSESAVRNASSSSLYGEEYVLLVEDEEPLRSLLARVLLEHGYQVMEAQNAGEAFLIAEDSTRKIDLVVTDVVMPHISGLHLARRLQHMRQGLRFLFVSGYAEDLANLDLSDIPNTRMLQKPFEPITFVENVRLLLDL